MVWNSWTQLCCRLYLDCVGEQFLCLSHFRRTFVEELLPDAQGIRVQNNISVGSEIIGNATDASFDGDRGE